jgi:hypothetical protein
MSRTNEIWDTIVANCATGDINNSRLGKEIKQLKNKEPQLNDTQLSAAIVSFCQWFTENKGTRPAFWQITGNWDAFRSALPFDEYKNTGEAKSQLGLSRRDLFKQLFTCFGKPGGAQLNEYVSNLEWVSEDVLKQTIARAIHSSDWLPSVATLGDIAYIIMHEIADPVAIWKAASAHTILPPQERAIVERYNLIGDTARGQSFVDFYNEQLRRQKNKMLQQRGPKCH